MRRSLILRQISASTTRFPHSAPKSSPTTSQSTSQQRKLPLPNLFTPGPIARLRRPTQDFLPSVINAPTTLPPVFIPPKEVNPREWFATGKVWYHKARSYAIFYKTGLKQFNANRKIRKQLKGELMKQLGNIQIPGSSMVAMCRSEFQMCVRTKNDWKKMPLFGLVILIAGEFTPIIAWLVGTRFLPGTCITTAQLDRRRRKRMDDLDRKHLPVTPRVTPTVEQVKQLPRRTLIHECRILGVFSRWTPVVILPTIFLREMLIRRVNYLEYDDELVRHFARPDLKDMNLEEVKWALEERGVSLYNVVPKELDKTGLIEKSPEDIYKLMKYWLKLNENKHPERGFSHEPYLKEMIRWRRLPDL